MPKKANPAKKFFYEHGGYSHDPKKETKAQGHHRSARELAEAEKIARDLGWRFEWEQDPEPYEMGDAETEAPDEVLMLALYNENDELVDSLGGIGMAGSQRERHNAGRVFEAEMALEYAHTRKLI